MIDEETKTELNFVEHGHKIVRQQININRIVQFIWFTEDIL
jgi:hypothetical protein